MSEAEDHQAIDLFVLFSLYNNPMRCRAVEQLFKAKVRSHLFTEELVVDLLRAQIHVGCHFACLCQACLTILVVFSAGSSECFLCYPDGGRQHALLGQACHKFLWEGSVSQCVLLSLCPEAGSCVGSPLSHQHGGFLRYQQCPGNAHFPCHSLLL